MAGSDGRDGIALDALLSLEPYRFDVRQAVRLLEQGARRQAQSPESEAAAPLPIGTGSDPTREAVRLRGSLTSRFPPSDIESLTPGGPHEPPSLTVTFFGLGGAAGPLPTPLTTRVVVQDRMRDHAARDFLDLFNHRLLSLFLRQWRLFHPALQMPAQADSPAKLPMLALLGLANLPPDGPASASGRMPGVMQSLIAATGLLNHRPVSAHALERLLEGHFGLKVRVAPLLGGWLSLAEDQATRLGKSGRLGHGAALGRRVWDQEAGIRIEIGPVSLNRLLMLLPGQTEYAELADLAGFALGDAFDVEFYLLLRPSDVPIARLGQDGSRLGWTSFLGCQPRHASAAVRLRLKGAGS